MRRLIAPVLVALALVTALGAGVVALLNFRGEADIPATAASFTPTPEQIARGEYLARAGNCIACHTARGSAPYAGGRAIPTPFGTIYSSNITPDAKTGIGYAAIVVEGVFNGSAGHRAIGEGPAHSLSAK